MDWKKLIGIDFGLFILLLVFELFIPKVGGGLECTYIETGVTPILILLIILSVAFLLKNEKKEAIDFLRPNRYKIFITVLFFLILSLLPVMRWRSLSFDYTYMNVWEFMRPCFENISLYIPKAVGILLFSQGAFLFWISSFLLSCTIIFLYNKYKRSRQ